MTWELLARTTKYINAGVAGEEECYSEVCGFYCMLAKENLQPGRKGIVDAMDGDDLSCLALETARMLRKKNVLKPV